jgi:hypothetical protein
VSAPDWIGSPESWGAWGRKATSWFNEVLTDLRAVIVSAAATQVQLDALSTATLGVGDGTGSITFPTNIGNFGAGLQALRVVVTRDEMVHVSGTILNSTGAPVADGGVVATLPSGWRPATVVLGRGNRTAGGARYDIEADGEIRIKQFNWPNGDFLSIDSTYQLA